MSDNILNNKRNIDIVFCIDATGSMGSCLESVKKNTLRFIKEYVESVSEKDLERVIESVRAKAIVFRNFKCDGENALMESPFFEIPTKQDEFMEYLKNVNVGSEGNEGANGLEALYKAMRSDFVTEPKGRQIIVLFTDSNFIPLGRQKDVKGYPSDMVDENGLIETWLCTQDHPSKLKERQKRLVIFAPEGSNYEELRFVLNRSVFVSMDIHKELDDFSFKDLF